MPPPTSPQPPISYRSSTVPNPETADRAEAVNVDFLRHALDDEETESSRTHIDVDRDPRRPQTQRQPSAQGRHDTPEDLSRRERLQRVLSRLNRLHEPTAPSTSTYSNRTPSPRRQDLYDWAPSYDNIDLHDRDLDYVLGELRRQQPETASSRANVVGQSQVSRATAPGNGNGNGTSTSSTTAAESTDRRERLRERERRRRDTEWVSLRARAAIQRSRQEGSPSATERMLRYVMRERSGLSEEEERARGSGWFRPSPSRSGNAEHRSSTNWALPPPASDVEGDRPERLEAFRREYLAENVPSRLPRVSTPTPPPAISSPPTTTTTFLENALKYLSELRSIPSSDGMDEDERGDRESQVLGLSMDYGLATKELWADKHDDFVMDLQTIKPLADSSWLQPGTVFDGHQHATNPGLIQPSRFRTSNVTHVLEQINPSFTSQAASSHTMGFDHPPGSTSVASFDATRPWLSHQPTLPSMFSKLLPLDPQHDQWPVRVTIHSIDAANMTLQGTMEAYDVPQHSIGSLGMLSSSAERPKAGKKNAPIITYLEGHIIDLTTHSFLTPDPTDNPEQPDTMTAFRRSNDIVFPAATPQIDGSNWRKLPPFAGLHSDDALARLLLSRQRLAALNKDYIFMRWKERCFVHSKDTPCSETDAGVRHSDRDRGHGLTISGFYYVSLSRLTGEVEGLYFDPGSTPYQVLRLKGLARGWPAMEFR
ncbi:hypothetical protein LTR10_002049 [Elasticomyces elasticus]|nr:hypothetical protein LTR10_002049 [Elasticomyces elasticus]KAK4973877.1 hypothetical protein LTR42_005867 [Elasticomyces elasticus]